MQATVHYVVLTDAERAEVNSHGWTDCQVGVDYHNALEGIYTPDSLKLVRAAAILDADSAEDIFTRLQNDFHPNGWCNAPDITCVSGLPLARSMCVGDLIIWGDGSCERCERIGFRKIDNPLD